MRWLWYVSTATVTCGFLRYPSDSRFFSSASSVRSVRPAALHASDQRKGEGAVGFDLELARQVGLVVHRHGQDVLGADRVVRLLTRGGKHEQARGQQCEQKAFHHCGNP